jgi:glycosyltransferase involved in cell wall biosynthesis
MVFYDMQDFGGLEEYATALIIGLQQQGHSVSALSCAWVHPDNQYLKRLQAHQIPFVQIPKWISLPASDWATKEKILQAVMWLLSPLTLLLGLVHFLGKRQSLPKSIQSAFNWLRGWVMPRIIEPDRRKLFSELLLARWRRTWRPDVLHLHGYTTNLLFVIDWAFKNRVPVAYEEHQTPDASLGWWSEFQDSINKSSVVVAVSEKSAQALKEVCKVHRPTIVRSPLLVDPASFGAPVGPRELRPGSALVATTVARLYVTKGIRYLLETAVQIKAAAVPVKFQVYGDGPDRQELFDYAIELGLDPQAIFVGAFNHDDLPEIMARTDIFLMSSILEGQPLALVEAMAYGCPIIATRVGGIPELIQDGVNGLLCEPADPNCLAEKLRTMVENPDLRLRLGQAARKSYEQGPFQPSAVSQELTLIYQRAVAETAQRENR